MSGLHAYLIQQGNSSLELVFNGFDKFAENRNDTFYYQTIASQTKIQALPVPHS